MHEYSYRVNFTAIIYATLIPNLFIELEEVDGRNSLSIMCARHGYKIIPLQSTHALIPDHFIAIRYFSRSSSRVLSSCRCNRFWPTTLVVALSASSSISGTVSWTSSPSTRATSSMSGCVGWIWRDGIWRRIWCRSWTIAVTHSPRQVCLDCELTIRRDKI